MKEFVVQKEWEDEAIRKGAHLSMLSSDGPLQTVAHIKLDVQGYFSDGFGFLAEDEFDLVQMKDPCNCYYLGGI